MAKTTRTAGKTAKAAKTAQTAKTATTAKTAKTATKSAKKHVGDVLGISRARVPKDMRRATQDGGGRPKGIEIPTATRRVPKRMSVVGGVRGRGR